MYPAFKFLFPKRDAAAHDLHIQSLTVRVCSLKTGGQFQVQNKPLIFLQRAAAPQILPVSGGGRKWTKGPGIWLERHPQLSLATRGEDWASQGQPKGKAEPWEVP